MARHFPISRAYANGNNYCAPLGGDNPVINYSTQALGMLTDPFGRKEFVEFENTLIRPLVHFGEKTVAEEIVTKIGERGFSSIPLNDTDLNYCTRSIAEIVCSMSLSVASREMLAEGYYCLNKAVSDIALISRGGFATLYSRLVCILAAKELGEDYRHMMDGFVSEFEHYVSGHCLYDSSVIEFYEFLSWAYNQNPSESCIEKCFFLAQEKIQDFIDGSNNLSKRQNNLKIFMLCYLYDICEIADNGFSSFIHSHAERCFSAPVNDLQTFLCARDYLKTIMYRAYAHRNDDVDAFADEIDKNDGRYKLLLDTVREFQPDVLLDAGCGKARYSKGLIEDCQGIDVIAMDPSDKLLKLIPENCKALEGFITNIPLPDSTVDFIFSIEVLEHAIAVPQALAEMARVLRPGGCMFIIDKNANSYCHHRPTEFEQWFLAEYVKGLMESLNIDVDVKQPVEYIYGDDPEDLFVAWIGRKGNELI